MRFKKIFLLFLTSVFILGQSAFSEGKTKDDAILKNYNFITHNGSFFAGEFVNENKNSINVSFTSNSPEECEVRLYLRNYINGDKEVGSFKVSPDKSKYKKFKVKKGKNYYVKVINKSGSTVSGSVKVK